MSISIVAPTPGILPPSPLYSHFDDHQRVIAATPNGVKQRMENAKTFSQIIHSNQYNQQHLNDHEINSTFEYGSFPLPHHPTNQSVTDIDASSMLQQIASSLSNLDAEQKYAGKENEINQPINDQMRVNEHEGKDGPSQNHNQQLFSQHEPAIVVRKQHQATEQHSDSTSKCVRAVDLVQHQRESEARDALMASLIDEQHAEMAALAALQFTSPPHITLPQPTTLPSTPPPLSQPAVDDSLMHRERPAVPKRFCVTDSELPSADRLHATDRGTSEAGVANASLFANALELSVLARTVPDLPDLPDYSDIALPVLPDVPNVAEPLPEELPGHDRPKSRAGSVVSMNLDDRGSAPAYLNAMPASFVAGQQSSQFGLAAPPRPNRPGRLSQGPIMPSAQKLNIHAPPPRSSMHSMQPISQAQQAQNAALNAALRTTLGDITDEQLEEVVSNK